MMLWRLMLLGAPCLLLLQSVVWAAEPVAVLTELRTSHGEVQVRLAGEADWKVAQALLSLRPGDQIRAAEDGRAVLVFTGGRGSQIVSPTNSPFTVHAPTTRAGTEKLQSLLASVTQFLLGKHKQPTYRSLAVRSLRQAPLLLAPRETKLLPGPLTFEWSGHKWARYTVRVFAPEGLVWEHANLPREPLAYPSEAPALHAGVQYAWQLEAEGHPRQRTHFQLLNASEAARIRSALNLLQPAALTGYPRNTVILMRAGLLFKEGLYHRARQELLAGITNDRDEPALHVLLGHVYERVGLEDLAAEEFDEAKFLSTHAP
ncbi:MAG: hypothetical protein ACE5NC_09370 [Anaerolineae bacterium]